MHKILDFQKLRTTEVNNDYFPYFVADNALREDLDTKALANDFPDLEKGGSFLSANTDAGPSIRELISELEGEEFKTLLENKFNLDLANSSLVTTLRGYSRKRDGQIHTDSKSKIVTNGFFLFNLCIHQTIKIVLLAYLIFFFLYLLNNWVSCIVSLLSVTILDAGGREWTCNFA